MTDPQPTAADREAAIRLLDIQAIRYHQDGTFRCWDDTCAAFTRHAQEREAQVIAGAVAWLLNGGHDSEMQGYANAFADAIERGDWKGPRHAD